MSDKTKQTSENSQTAQLPAFEKKQDGEVKKQPLKKIRPASAKNGQGRPEKRVSIKGALTKKSPLAKESENSPSKSAKTNKTPSNKKSAASSLVKQNVKASEHNAHAKLIFIISMILLTPLALLVALAVIALFLAVLFVTLIAGGVMAIVMVGAVAAGVLFSCVGSAYGAINLLTGEGFELVTGQYELGLGLAIAGITIVACALLYSGITDLVPFIFRKCGQLFKFLVKKVRQLIRWLYQYSTQL